MATISSSMVQGHRLAVVQTVPRIENAADDVDVNVEGRWGGRPAASTADGAREGMSNRSALALSSSTSLRRRSMSARTACVDAAIGAGVADDVAVGVADAKVGANCCNGRAGDLDADGAEVGPDDATVWPCPLTLRNAVRDAMSSLSPPSGMAMRRSVVYAVAALAVGLAHARTHARTHVQCTMSHSGPGSKRYRAHALRTVH